MLDACDTYEAVTQERTSQHVGLIGSKHTPLTIPHDAASSQHRSSEAMSDEIAEGFAERMHNQCSAALSQLFAATIRCGTPHEDGLDPTNHLLHNASLVMTAAGAPRTSRPFRLMDLPGELRTHIHEV